jgi:CO/xanthine dehydrogenase Mo-binding subunit
VKFEAFFRTIDKEVGFWLAMPGGSSGLIGNLQSLVRAAKKAKQLVLEYAAKERPGFFGGPPQPALFPGKTPEELDMKDGEIFEKAHPDNKIPIAMLAAHSAHIVAWDYAPSVTANKYVMVRQCWFMEVEVDPDTGKCDVKKVVSVYDGGKVISPEGFEDQQYGGTYMGVGRSNTEQVIWDPIEGVKLNDNLIGYDIALMNDITEGVDCYAVEKPDCRMGPYGTCGCSEAPAANVSAGRDMPLHNAIGKWLI